MSLPRPEFPMVLVANKADLESERVVSGQDGESLALELKVSLIPIPHSLIPILHITHLQIKYVETSAKHRIHVDKAFHDLVRVIRQAQKPTPVKVKKKKRACTIL